MATPINATGWTELMNADMIGAAYAMYSAAGGEGWGIWFVPILFFVYELMLFIKTKNLVLTFIMAAVFASLYATSAFVEPLTVPIIIMIMIFQFTAVLYMWFFKK